MSDPCPRRKRAGLRGAPKAKTPSHPPAPLTPVERLLRALWAQPVIDQGAALAALPAKESK
jgi:hypothetical protein